MAPFSGENVDAGKRRVQASLVEVVSNCACGNIGRFSIVVQRFGQTWTHRRAHLLGQLVHGLLKLSRGSDTKHMNRTVCDILRACSRKEHLKVESSPGVRRLREKLLWRSPKRPERPMGISGAGHLTDVHVNKQRPRLDILLLDSHDESHSTFSKGIDGVWLTADLGWHIICGIGQS